MFVLQKALNGLSALLSSERKTRAAMPMHSRCCGGPWNNTGGERPHS